MSKRLKSTIRKVNEWNWVLHDTRRLHRTRLFSLSAVTDRQKGWCQCWRERQAVRAAQAPRNGTSYYGAYAGLDLHSFAIETQLRQ